MLFWPCHHQVVARDEMIEKLDSAALRTIRRCFDDYDCVPLPVPVDGGAKQLQGMDKMALQVM